MKSKVVLLPCRDYEEEKVYTLLKTGLELLAGKKCIRCFCCQEMCPKKAIKVK